MTGIFGYFDARAPSETSQIAGNMGALLAHKDYMRIDLRPSGQHGALGRLTIGLLNEQPQPICSTDGNVTLVMCGELYHHASRRSTMVASGALSPDAGDAGMALHLFLTGGVEELTRLNGAFIMAVWDERSQSLWIVNDRFGLFPHYYGHSGSCFTFAPEMKALLSVPGVPRKLDLIAVAQYTRFQQLLGERTWFEDIHLLPPATILQYQPLENRLALRTYWDWDQIQPVDENITLNDAADETIRLFDRAVKEMTRPPLRPGVFLSGGLDGRAILGVARDYARVPSFTFGAPDSRDVLVSRKIARRSGSKHHWFPMNDGRWVLEYADEHLTLTEGQHSWMHAHGIQMLADARETIDVNLSGWDGGTVLGGYITEHGYDDLLRHSSDEETFAQRFYHGFCNEYTWPGLTESEADALFGPPGSPNLHGLAFDSLRQELTHTQHVSSPYRADYFYVKQHCRRSTQNMIVFARSAIEVRCPYFDYDLVTFLYGLPERLRRSFDLQHSVLTRRMPDLAMIPNEKDNLPPHTSRTLRFAHRAAGKARRTANRFLPVFPDHPRLYADYENYLRGELAGWAESILFAPQTMDRGLFNPTTVRDLWERHLHGDQLWTIGKIAPLITLELVLRRFHDEGTGSHDQADLVTSRA